MITNYSHNINNTSSPIENNPFNKTKDIISNILNESDTIKCANKDNLQKIRLLNDVISKYEQDYKKLDNNLNKYDITNKSLEDKITYKDDIINQLNKEINNKRNNISNQYTMTTAIEFISPDKYNDLYDKYNKSKKEYGDKVRDLLSTIDNYKKHIEENKNNKNNNSHSPCNEF